MTLSTLWRLRPTRGRRPPGSDPERACDEAEIGALSRKV